MDRPIEVTAVGGGLEAELEERILAFNVEATGFDDGKSLCAALRDDDGELVAGLSGWTWGGCGYIEWMWVRERDRGKGIGARILEAAEREAFDRGCSQMVVDSHSFQAPGFYERLGYVEYGRVQGYPRGHAHVHLAKALSST